jgi:hypothetical protein
MLPEACQAQTAVDQSFLREVVEVLERVIAGEARHPFNCSANRNFERECDCGWYEVKGRLPALLDRAKKGGV